MELDNMPSGFRDLLAWLLGWKSNYPFIRIPGPYLVKDAQVYFTGAGELGLVQIAGETAAETFSPGGIVGMAAHAGAALGMTFENHVTIGSCNG
jgi:hypothetical protein